MAEKKDGSLLGGLLGAAAVAGAAKVISDLEKEAKQEGKDILDVAKEKVDDIVEDAKSGELEQNIKEKVGDLVKDVKDIDLQKDVIDKANKLVDDAKSGELKNKVEDKIKDIAAEVQSDEFKAKASETVQNLKDGVIDILDGKDNM